VILHCFSMAARLDECVQQGWWISFAGNVTYPKAQDLAAAAERVPAERLLVETDAPYLTPQPRRKEPNQPAYVTHTAHFVAQRRGIAYEELEQLVERNAAALFAW
jgi:TatD DNase family protein